MIQVKRIYDPPSIDDGHRVLVDRIWPRGVPKDAARLDDWMKDVAPSPNLRTWFGHDPKRWDEFMLQYWAELKGEAQAACIEELKERGSSGTVTLLYAANDARYSHALVLLGVLQAKES